MYSLKPKESEWFRFWVIFLPPAKVRWQQLPKDNRYADDDIQIYEDILLAGNEHFHFNRGEKLA